MTLDDSLSLWKHLKQKGGLDLSRNPKGNDGYDVDLELRLKDYLFPAQHGTLDKNLEKSAIPVERFLAAFLQAQLPFSMMMTDILGFFEKAGAQHGTNNLKIEFDFTEGKKLGLDLDHFRHWTSVMQKVVTTRSAWIWNPTACWECVYLLRSLFKDGDNSESLAPRYPFGSNGLEILHSTIKVWCKAHGLNDSGGFLPPPNIPRSGNTGLDALIWRSEALVSDFHQDCLKVAPTYDRLRQISWALNNFPADEDTRALAQVASDHWAASMIEALTILSERIKEVKMPLNPTLTKVNDLLDSIYTGSKRVEELREMLDSFLSLPSWERRHEIYAVWVATQIADAMSDDKVSTVFHVVGNTLSFPFSGVHLATFFTETPAAFMFWTELRSKLSNKVASGRANIQPDYRIVALPFDPATTTILVVECKQYRRSSTKNFSQALNDYAIGCPNAQVALVNNGPIGSKVAASIDSKQISRTSLFSDFRPDSKDVKERFRQLVCRAVLGDRTASRPLTKLPTEGGAIRLSWGSSFQDLDLYVVIRSECIKPETISYKNTGDQAKWPWLELIEDFQHGPAEEVMLVSQWQDAIYDIYVHNFSSNEQLDSPQLNVIIEHPALPRPETIPSLTPRAFGRWWHVCSVDGVSGKVTLMSQYYNDPPSAITFSH